MFKKINKRSFSQIDWQIIVPTFLLCACGLLIVYSAGFDPKKELSKPAENQVLSMGIAFVCFFISMFLNTKFWKKAAYPIYVIGCILLIMIITKGVVAGGARRWLDLGGFRMQPSEVTKLGLILVLARIFSSDSAPKTGRTFTQLIVPGLIILFPAMLIERQPDLGTAMCHILIGGSMLLLAGIRPKVFFSIALITSIVLIPVWSFVLKDYQKQRVLTFMSPEIDPQGSGYHALQSRIAVGSGALYGKGFLKGTQTQLRFLPEQTTDFIFSVLAEEWGFVGSVFVIALYGFLILRILKIASRCEDTFKAYVSFGVAAMLFWHVFINIGMVIGVLPVVGITLALLSFGGSSLVVIVSSIGIVAGFSIRKYLFG